MFVLSVLLLLAPLGADPDAPGARGSSLDGLSEVPSWASPSRGVSGGPTPGAAPAAIGANLPPTPGGVPAAIPVDGGLALLAAAGLGYGMRRLRARRR